MSNKHTVETLLAIALLILCLMLGGCGSMKGESLKIRNPADPNIIILEYYKVSYEHLFLDFERQGWNGQVEGFGSIGSVRSRVESEGAEIVEDATGIVDPLRKVKP